MWGYFMVMLMLTSTTRCFGGVVRKYVHDSLTTKTPMTFSVFLPPQAEHGRVPVLYWLSGLTCNEDNFIQKAGAQRAASETGVALVCPDTSPRGLNIPTEHESWDFGSGAGFYVNATTDAWKDNYNMYDYVTTELPDLVRRELPVTDRQSIFGHSMGGHGALCAYLKSGAGVYRSVSAFAPICNPTRCAWGVKAFTGYLGADNTDAWKAWDATELVRTTTATAATAAGGTEILIDQGGGDNFLEQGQLMPEAFVAAASEAGVPVRYRLQDGYDHSYFFISTFVDEHIRFHAKCLHHHTS